MYERKQLFDSNAALRILPNFGDRLVYSFSQHATLAVFRRRRLANAGRLTAHLIDGEKVL